MRRRRVPLVPQMELGDCGAACLAMVLAYHGRVVRLEELRMETGTDRDGVGAVAILEAARRYGLSARGVAADVGSLGHLPRGSILHWDFDHFVVFEGADRRGVDVVDPAVGRRRVPMDTFRHSFTGVALVFEPTEDFAAGRGHAAGTWRYVRPLLGQSRSLGRVLVASVVIRVLAVAFPILTGLVVDEIAPSRDRHLLTVVAVAMLAVVLYQLLAAVVRAQLLLQLRTHLDVRLTTTFVEHLVRLPYSFFLRRSAGDLMMRLQSNSEVREILTTGALAAVLDGTLATGYLVALFVVDATLGALVLGLGVLQVAVLVGSWRRHQRLMAESLEVESRSQSYTYELLAGVETLKAMGAETRAAERWQGFFAEEINATLARGRLTAWIEALTGTLEIGSPLVILVFGAFRVLDGDLSLGAMLAATALAVGFLEPLGALVEGALPMAVTRSYMERLNDVLDTPQEQAGETVVPAPRLAGHVVAENLSFRYSPRTPPVVVDVSLEVRPGQQLGIAGRSGAGKSTLAHLLLGLYPPTSGRILFDGLDLTTLEVRSVRRQLGIVTQRPYLFGASIAENIAFNAPGAGLDEIMDAARLACVHDDIMALPLGYETLLGDGGSSLSGGQQQRIALARALVHRPAILLLDEATSDLDSLTERRIFEQLAGLRCTTIVIAHRLSTIRHADTILVMEAGRVTERGTHDDLVALGGAYSDLVAAQEA
ncbi:MAG: peptidase domain-containing ABC transporter [Actinomycetota bacterium]